MRTIPHDKANHFFFGDLSALAGYLVCSVPALKPYRLVGAAAACALVALGREAYNVWRARSWSAWSWADVAWTLAGGATVLAPAGAA